MSTGQEEQNEAFDGSVVQWERIDLLYPSPSTAVPSSRPLSPEIDHSISSDCA